MLLLKSLMSKLWMSFHVDFSLMLRERAFARGPPTFWSANAILMLAAIHSELSASCLLMSLSQWWYAWRTFVDFRDSVRDMICLRSVTTRVWAEPAEVTAIWRQISRPVTTSESELNVLMMRRTVMLGSPDVEWSRTYLRKLSAFMSVDTFDIFLSLSSSISTWTGSAWSWSTGPLTPDRWSSFSVFLFLIWSSSSDKTPSMKTFFCDDIVVARDHLGNWDELLIISDWEIREQFLWPFLIRRLDTMEWC